MRCGVFSGRLKLGLTCFLALIVLGTLPQVGFAARKAVPDPVAGNFKPDSWIVNLESYPHEDRAKQELERLKMLGLPVEILQVNIHGKSWYRIRITGFASPEEARKELGNLENRLNMHGMWVSKRFPQLADAGVSANRIDVPAPVIPANDSPIHQDEKPAEVLIII